MTREDLDRYTMEVPDRYLVGPQTEPERRKWRKSLPDTHQPCFYPCCLFAIPVGEHRLWCEFHREHMAREFEKAAG